MPDFDAIQIGDYVTPTGGGLSVEVKGKCRAWKFSRTLTCDVIFSEDGRGNTVAYRMDELLQHHTNGPQAAAVPVLQADDPVIVGVSE